jgi:outer membrane protein assembly factor BamB
MKFPFFPILISILIGAASAAHAGDIDWPQFRFSDAHTGVNKFEKTLNQTNVPMLEQAWQAQLGDIVDFSSPAVAGGAVYIGTIDGTLWAYPADGCGASFCDTPLWQSTNLAQIMDSPTVANGIVYVGSQTDQDSAAGKLNAFAAAGCGAPVCAPLWQGVAGSQSILESSPTVADGVVYVGAFDGQLYAFNADGCGASQCQPLWVGRTGGSIESTPLVAKGFVFVGSDDGKLYAFKAKGCGGKSVCKPKWTGDLGSAVFQSSPAIANGVVYIGSQHAISAFDAKGCGAKRCAPLWQGIDNDNFFNGSPAIHGGHVYIGWETSLAAYAADGCGQTSCAREWVLFGDGFQADVLSSSTIAGGVVYAGRNTGEVLAWKEGSCGKPSCSNIWSGMTNDEIVSSSPAVVNGKVYIGSADKSFPENISGRIYVFSLPR